MTAWRVAHIKDIGFILDLLSTHILDPCQYILELKNSPQALSIVF